MRKIIFYVALIALMMSSCSKSDDNNESGLSTDARPEWTVVTEGVAPQGMYIIMDSEGLPTVNGTIINTTSADILGAFVSDECRGVAVPYSEIDGKTHFYLKVKSTDTDASNAKVELRYYSGEKKHIFCSEQFSFVADGNVGTLEDGYKPTWK